MTAIPARRSASLPAACLRLSALAGAVGVVTIGAMFSAFAAGATEAGQAIGFVNDVAVLVTYAAAVPGVLAVRRALAVAHPRAAGAGSAFALSGIAITVVAQATLVAGVVTFEQQWPWATAGLLAFGAWCVATAWVARRDGSLPYGPGLGLAALLYIGYPAWALRVARWMDGRRA